MRLHLRIIGLLGLVVVLAVASIRTSEAIYPPRRLPLVRSALEAMPQDTWFAAIGSDIAEDIRVGALPGRKAWEDLPHGRKEIFMISFYEPMLLQYGVVAFAQFQQIREGAPTLSEMSESYRTIGVPQVAEKISLYDQAAISTISLLDSNASSAEPTAPRDGVQNVLMQDNARITAAKAAYAQEVLHAVFSK